MERVAGRHGISVVAGLLRRCFNDDDYGKCRSRREAETWANRMIDIELHIGGLRPHEAKRSAGEPCGIISSCERVPRKRKRAVYRRPKCLSRKDVSRGGSSFG